MPASKKSKEEVERLEENRHHDSEAKQQWTKLVQDYDDENGTTTPADLKGEPLKALMAKLAAFLDERGEAKSKERETGCGDGGPCGDKQQGQPRIDLETLADLVFKRLILEARIEQERAGWGI